MTSLLARPVERGRRSYECAPLACNDPSNVGTAAPGCAAGASPPPAPPQARAPAPHGLGLLGPLVGNSAHSYRLVPRRGGGLRLLLPALLLLGAVPAHPPGAVDDVAKTPGVVSAASLARRHQFENGLVLLTEERPTSRAVSVALLAGAGSRDDGETPGLLYFLSRAQLLGTGRRPSVGAIQQAISSTGGALERGTARDMTQLVATVPAAELDTALDLLADIVQNSLFDEAALEREKTVVGLEINRRLGNPSEVASDLVYATLFDGHPLGRPIVGSAESIRALDRELLLAARDRYYGASNLVLALVGRFRHDDVVTKVEGLFGAMPAGNRKEVAPDMSELQGIRMGEERRGRQQAIVQVAVRGPAATHPDRHPFTLLNDVLGLTSGRIFTEIRVKRGLAYVAGSGWSGFQDTGVWVSYAGTDPQNVDQVVELLLEEMRRVREEPLTQEELEGAIGHALGRELVSSESNSARALRLGRRELLGLTEADEALMDGLRRVTVEDVQRVAQTYFDPDRYVVVVVKP